MKGATAEPSVKMIKAPSNARKRTIGVNHHFFLSLKNSQNSDMIASLLTYTLLFMINHDISYQIIYSYYKTIPGTFQINLIFFMAKRVIFNRSTP